MPPPNPKFAKAYRAMRALGYTQQIVKPVLKNLLVLYNHNWQHIEDGNYSVLVDAILESEEHKEKERQRFRLVDEPEEDEPPLKRSKLGSQTVETFSSPGDSNSSSIGITDKRLHHVDYVTSEPDGKKRMIEAVKVCLFDDERETKLLSAVPHCQGEVKTGIPNPSSVSKPKKKIQVLSHDKSNESDTSCSIVPRMINERDKRTVSWKGKNIAHDNILSSQKNMLNKDCSDIADEIELLPDVPSELEVPLSIIPPDNVKLLTEGDSPNAEEQFSTSPEPINLDIGDTSALCLYREDDSSNGNDYLCHGNCPEYEGCAADKKENCSSNSSLIDIASSSKGEVKLSITYESSLPSKFHVPSLDSVLRRMEEKLLNSYRITPADFSLMNLMKDVCEAFLEVGTNTTHDKEEICTDLHSNRVAPKESGTQDDLNGNINYQTGFCVAPNISMEHVQLQNLIEIQHQIPKFQNLNYLDFSGCKTDLTMEGSYNERIKSNLEFRDVNSSTSSSMVIIQKQQFPQDMLSFAYYIDDVTRGEENLQISLINEFNNEDQPMFKYIPRNITYQSAYVKFLLACISDDNCCSNCFGDCLSSEIPCACAGETGGEFAYMPGGIIKEKFLYDFILMNRSPQQKNLFHCQECPLERSKDKSLSGTCKGHLIQKFIKECWYKCGCSKHCGNRVVQRGIMRRLQVFMTPEGKGWGLRTLEDLPKGAFICEYVGEIVTNMELFERNSQNTGKEHTYPVLLDADWCTEGVLKDEEALCLDATLYGNVARFVNHRCYDANLVEIPVEVETPDHHYYHLAFFTTRKVAALEELTWDYGIDFSDHTHPVKAFKCHCGSQFCRDTSFKK